MDALTQDEIKEIYEALPEDLQDAIFSPETMDIYNQIKERYGLDQDQRKEISIQTGLLMMGITEPKEYVLVLAEKLGVPRDKAAFIAQEVNRNILHPVRESLKAIHAPDTQAAPITQSVVPEALAQAPATLSPIQPPISPSSTLNQKLGESFRVPTAPQAPVPNYSIPTPPVPPAVQPETSTAPVAPPAPRTNDPYRELPL